MRRFIAVATFIALIGSAAFAQLMVYGSGAIRTDSSDLAASFKSFGGKDTFWGGGAELVFGNLGIGASANVSFYNDVGIDWMDYDATAYLSYHLFGGRAFLDPFGEVGGGQMGSDYAKSKEKPSALGDKPVAANYYWYAAPGVGINLGGIGVFGKFAFNFLIDTRDTYPNGDYVPQVGSYSLDANGNPVVTPIMPAYRFQLGVKLIL
jgi:hypothetical protein